MKDTSITDKDAAINDFKSTHVFSGVTSNLNYYTEAWSSYVTGNTVYNGDEDPTAIFVFQRSDFRDVGFTATDALGQTVNSNDVNITLTMSSFKGRICKLLNSTEPTKRCNSKRKRK